MPIYEYKCTKCDNDFEKLVFAGDEESIACPDCKSLDVQKKMSASNFMGSSSIGGNCTPNPSQGFS